LKLGFRGQTHKILAATSGAMHFWRGSGSGDVINDFLFVILWFLGLIRRQIWYRQVNK
jgi:hypothetical protein